MKRLLRVVHVIGPLQTGGAQTQLLGLVRAAHGTLWDATVVATSGGALASNFADVGCPFVELRRWGSPGLLRMRSLRKIVESGDFDVVHSNLWQSNAYARVAVMGRSNRPAVVISERNVEAERSAVKRAVDRVLASVTDAYVGNTYAVTQFLGDVHPTDGRIVTTIANAVDTSIFHRPDQEPPSPPVRIGAVGRLDREKGFDVLIEAAKRLQGRMAFEVEIVGEGPERNALEEAARGQPVRFVGNMAPGHEVAAFLRSLHVFVLPSRFREGRPNALLEALACERPVVTTDIAGLREIIRGPTLVPPGDEQALAEAIVDAAHDPNGWRAATDPAPVVNFAQLGKTYHDLFEAAIARQQA